MTNVVGDTVVVMGDMGKIPTVSSAVSSSVDPMVDAKAISTVVSKFFIAGVGGDIRNIPKVAYAVDDDTVAIPVEGAVGDTSDGYSCHGRVEQVKLNENLSKSVSVSVRSIIPPWVHVFCKVHQVHIAQDTGCSNCIH